jgi:hypothetical protein
MLKFNTSKTAVAEEVRVGGGFKIYPTSAYVAKIIKAFFTTSKEGANAVNLEMELSKEGQALGTYKETVYFTNRKGDTFYKDKNTGAEMALPGFTIVNELCLLLGGEELDTLNKQFGMTVEEIKNYATNTMDSVQVPSAKPLLGKTIGVLIQEVKEFSQEKINGVYVTSPDKYTRSSNAIQRFYNEINNCTVIETKSGLAEGVIVTKWLENNDQKVYDKTKGAPDNPRPKGTPVIATGESKATGAHSYFKKE